MDGLYSYKHKDEKQCVNTLLQALPYNPAQQKSIAAAAGKFVEYARTRYKKSAPLQKFIQEYNLSSAEGLSLMTLAEALLRVPDRLTANALIADKLNAADWNHHILSADDILVKISSLGLATSKGVINSMVKRLGMPVIREATFGAMKILGNLFVLGQDIDDAITRGKSMTDQGFLYSYDMLGEGARTVKDAETYFQNYLQAIETIGALNKDKSGNPLKTHGISVKLSALHAKYHYAFQDECVPALQEKLLHLAQRAAHHGIGLTMDAEEADRLMISLDIFEEVSKHKSLQGWDGLGLAVQSYQKRCFGLISHLTDMSQSHHRKLCIRLVKGAYWDTEIKQSQLLNHPDYPVFTRKSNTDLSYLAAAHKMLENRQHITPMIATHNAHTIAAVLNFAGKNKKGFAFQRLHGMGEDLYAKVADQDIPISIYGPVGAHKDLLPYLVRRLLENGANSSFINKIYTSSLTVEEIVGDPVKDAKEHEQKRHLQIPLPKDIYQPDRENSRGIDLTDDEAVKPLYTKMQKTAGKLPKRPKDAVSTDIDKAFEKTKSAFKKWTSLPADERANLIEKAGHLIEENTENLMALCVKEAGKTVPDALADAREAVEFAHYYAARGREDFAGFTELQGPTGEKNIYRMRGRGTFVCISPWNFPVAIFAGQIIAALMAGNCVIAKPAEQTPIIADAIIKLMHKAGIPKDVLILLCGDGKIGAQIIAHKDVAGVAFTGSTTTARKINQTLANKENAPIVPLIAETGGLNAMIVDSTALPEQVVDDALISGFGSAGQRCSALRLLCLQEDTADTIIEMMMGAMDTMRVGDPWKLRSQVGPVIDETAFNVLNAHEQRLEKEATILKIVPNMASKTHQDGHPYFAPILAEIDDISFMEKEVFGPIIHVLRYKAKDRDKLIEQINELGYGLTFGFHSRILAQADKIIDEIAVGNIYINRSIIGAVVGVQPFGGQGLSGTGPKAGGPNYLKRFAVEQVVSINTTAAGGNTTLVTLQE
jgi:RHH-type proline utilization regulon transcriptional repressor/proline dehydrogenase/delta 1-pyrroline-5-carboxylate dehydrogenase